MVLQRRLGGSAVQEMGLETDAQMHMHTLKQSSLESQQLLTIMLTLFSSI